MEKFKSETKHHHQKHTMHSLVILNMFIKALELADLEGEDSHQNHHHEQERINPTLNEVLHFSSNSYKTRYKPHMI